MSQDAPRRILNFKGASTEEAEDLNQDLATELEKTTKKIPNRMVQGDVMEIWKDFISGKSPFQISKERGPSVTNVVKAIQYVRHKLGGLLNAKLEQQKLIEHTRLLVGGLTELLKVSREILDSIDLARKGFEKTGLEKLLPVEMAQYNSLIVMRQSEIRAWTQVTAEIRNHNLMLSDLTGAKLAAKKLPGVKPSVNLEDKLESLTDEQLNAFIKAANLDQLDE